MTDKRLAKRIALTLNNTAIAEGKKSRFIDHMWNMKYLHRFNVLGIIIITIIFY